MSRLILLIDDEPKILKTMRGYLEKEGFEVVTAANGREALFAARDHRPDLIVLDLMMPEMDGWEFMRHHRQERDTPIIMLTARVDDIDKIAGLEAGADDYMTKPFSPRELLARIKTVLRRSDKTAAAPARLLRGGDLLVDEEGFNATLRELPLELTRTEFDLLVLLMKHPGRAFSRMEILEKLYDYTYEGYERTVDVHIKNLRKKIEADPGTPQYILTAYGVGYRFNPEL